jgi:hypothetical protein
MERPKDIFISYSSKDAAIVNSICNYLENSGLTCWIAPRDVRTGFTYASEIIGAIKSCKILLLVVSASSIESGHVANEIANAFTQKKHIIPFKIDKTPLNDDLNYYLSRVHRITALANPE